MTGNPNKVSLEKAAQDFVDATSVPPFLWTLTPEEGRKAVDGVQDSPIDKPDVDDEWITTSGSEKGLDSSTMAVAGDSVGGNMAIALTLLAKERGDVRFRAQLLFYPVTDAAFDTASYKEFAVGYYLTLEGMKWFWDQYTTDEAEGASITASPLRATTEQLAGLPTALVINGEADVLRDEGEAYAGKLRDAGVEVTQVRYAATIHDFVMLNALHDTHASKAAVAQAVAFLSEALHGK